MAWGLVGARGAIAEVPLIMSGWPLGDVGELGLPGVRYWILHRSERRHRPGGVEIVGSDLSRRLNRIRIFPC